MEQSSAYVAKLVAEMALTKMPKEEAVSAAVAAMTAATAATPNRRYYVPLTAGGIVCRQAPATQ